EGLAGVIQEPLARGEQGDLQPVVEQEVERRAKGSRHAANYGSGGAQSNVRWATRCGANTLCAGTWAAYKKRTPRRHKSRTAAMPMLGALKSMVPRKNRHGPGHERLSFLKPNRGEDEQAFYFP